MSVIRGSARREAIELLQTLIKIRSVNPPGEEDRVTDYIENYLSELGIEFRRIPLEPGRSSLVARIPGESEGSYVLCGHMDTVDTDPAKWTLTDPFTPRVEGERLWGLGSADMKGGVAVILQTAKEIVRQRVTPPHDLVLAFTADEECAYRGAASVAASGLIDDARLLLIMEPTGGSAYIGQKGELWIEATFHGRAAHGSIPESGVSAILPAATFCTRLHERSRAFPEIQGLGTTSLNIGQFEGGWQVNVVPDTATLRLDSRVVTQEERDRVVALVEELGSTCAGACGARFEYCVFNDQARIVSDWEAPDVQRFLRVHNNVTGKPIQARIAPYSTDAVAIVPQISVPVVIYGPGCIEQAHQPDEYLELNSLYEALEIVTCYLTGEDGVDWPSP